MTTKELEKIISIITTHTEHDGSYCDTGEDMGWRCRSECMNMAVERLEKLLPVSVLDHAFSPMISDISICEVCGCGENTKYGKHPQKGNDDT